MYKNFQHFLNFFSKISTFLIGLPPTNVGSKTNIYSHLYLLSCQFSLIKCFSKEISTLLWLLHPAHFLTHVHYR